jgi:hypothetical protein
MGRVFARSPVRAGVAFERKPSLPAQWEQVPRGEWQPRPSAVSGKTPARTGEADVRPSHWGFLLAQARAEVHNTVSGRMHPPLVSGSRMAPLARNHCANIPPNIGGAEDRTAGAASSKGLSKTRADAGFRQRETCLGKCPNLRRPAPRLCAGRRGRLSRSPIQEKKPPASRSMQAALGTSKEIVRTAGWRRRHPGTGCPW